MANCKGADFSANASLSRVKEVYWQLATLFFSYKNAVYNADIISNL